MSRLEALFARLRARQETAILPYLTVGYPRADETVPLGLELLRAGADGLELGIPFSDPLADGVTLQAVSQQALEAGGAREGALATAPGPGPPGATAPRFFWCYNTGPPPGG